jgi:hypothetical protein
VTGRASSRRASLTRTSLATRPGAAALCVAIATVLAACNPPGAGAPVAPEAVSTLSVPRALFESYGIELLDFGVFRLDTGQRVVTRSTDVSQVSGDLTFSVTVPAGPPLLFRANAGSADRLLDGVALSTIMTGRAAATLQPGSSETVELFLDYFGGYAWFGWAAPFDRGGSRMALVYGGAHLFDRPSAESFGAEFGVSAFAATAAVDGTDPGALAIPPERGAAPVFHGWARVEEFARTGAGYLWLAAYDLSPTTCPADELCSGELVGPIRDDLGWAYGSEYMCDGTCWAEFWNGAVASRYQASVARSGGLLKVTVSPTYTYPDSNFDPDFAAVIYRAASGNQVDGVGQWADTYYEATGGGLSAQGYDSETGTYGLELPYFGPGTLQVVHLGSEYPFGSYYSKAEVFELVVE